jgi:RNA polymerase sigma-70 factor (ECF subfamily)
VDPAVRAALEVELRRRAEAGDLAGVITEAIGAYGPELLGFLGGLARDAVEADELFASVCEKLWKALPKFRWDSTFRVWAYTVARNEFYSARRGSRKRAVPLSQAPAVQEAVAKARTTTALHQRTDVKDAFAQLREALEPEDRMLLALRVDRGLEWGDIARVLGASEASLKRETANLRKRFERLKTRLRELAHERGLRW